MSEFVPIAVPLLSVGVLLTGLLLGWGSKWGVLRYRWVAVKLVLSVVMVILVFTGQIPGVNDLRSPDATTSADAVRDSLGSAPSQMMFPPIVSFLMFGTTAVLSIYKPWRRTPWTTPNAGREAWVRLIPGSSPNLGFPIAGTPSRRSEEDKDWFAPDRVRDFRRSEGARSSPLVIVAGHIAVEPQQRDTYLAGRVRIVEQARRADGCLDFAISADLIVPAASTSSSAGRRKRRSKLSR